MNTQKVKQQIESKFSMLLTSNVIIKVKGMTKEVKEELSNEYNIEQLGTGRFRVSRA